MNTLNKNKGITMISMIITIVIIIILSLVTVTTINDTGLFSKTKQAGKDYKAAEKNEVELIDNTATLNETVNSDKAKASSPFVYNDLQIYSDGDKHTYMYKDKEIYPIYWYGYKPNTFMPIGSYASSKNISELEDLTKSTLGYLQIASYDQIKSAYFGAGEGLPYKDYKKLIIDVKSFSGMDGYCSCSFGIREKDEPSKIVKAQYFHGEHTTYTNDVPTLTTGKHEIDLSDVDFSKFKNPVVVITCYKENDYPKVVFNSIYLEK